MESLEERVTPATYNITGGAGTDILILKSFNSGNGKLDYNLNGADLTVTDNTIDHISVNLGDGANTLILDTGWSFNVDVTFTGGADTDELRGNDSASTITLTSANGGTLVRNSPPPNFKPVTFTGVETVQAGGGGDTFNVNVSTSATLKGGSGNDTFNLSLDPNVEFTGTIDGEGGNDTLTAANLNAGTVTNVETISVIGTLTGSGTFTWTGTAWMLNGQSYGNPLHVQGEGGNDTFNINANLLGIRSVKGGAGDDQFVFANGIEAAATVTIDGETGSDTLDLSAYTTAVNVTVNAPGANGYSGTARKGATLGSGNVVAGFVGIDAFVGGTSAADRLSAVNLNAADVSGFENVTVSGTLTGSGTFTWNGTNWSLNGQSYGNPMHVQGEDGNDTFNINANLTGNRSVKGGGGNDQFVFANGIEAAATVTIDGEGDSDTLDLSAYTTAVNIVLGSSSATGFSGTARKGTTLGSGAVIANFAGVDVITAGSNTADALQGQNADATWALGATRTYTVGTRVLTFSGFHTLQGGTGKDTFNIEVSVTATLNGGGGDDTFVFANNVVVTGAVTGGGGKDTLDFSSYTAGLSVALSNSGANGFNGTVGLAATPNPKVITGDFTGIDAIVGGQGADRLSGREGVTSSDWRLNGAGNTVNETNVYKVGTAELEFRGFSDLIGRTNRSDEFIFLQYNPSITFGAAFNSLRGSSSGQGNGGTLNYREYLQNVLFTLDLITETFANGISNIRRLVGTGQSLHKFQGKENATVESGTPVGEDPPPIPDPNQPPSAPPLTIPGFDGNPLILTDIGYVSGSNTTFKMVPGFWSFFIEGDGTDTLDFSEFDVPVRITLTTLADNPFTIPTDKPASGVMVSTFTFDTDEGPITYDLPGWFFGISRVVGSSFVDSLTGPNVGTAWDLTGGASGLEGTASWNEPTLADPNLVVGVTTRFDGFEVLSGGSATDVVRMNHDVAVTSVSGGGGTNTLEVTSDGTTSTTWTSSTANGGTVAWTDGPASSILFSLFQRLLGGEGTDRFVLNAGSAFTFIDGGGVADPATQEPDTLDYSGFGSAVTVSLKDRTVTSAVAPTLDFDRIRKLIAGGDADDTLVGPDRDNKWVSTGADAGTISDLNDLDGLLFEGFKKLFGGGLIDIFNMNVGQPFTVIDGKEGTNTLKVFSRGGNDHDTVTWTSSAAYDGTVVWVDGTDDTVSTTTTFRSIQNWVGDQGTDHFVLNAGARVDEIDGVAGSDILDFHGFNAAVTLNLHTQTVTSDPLSFPFRNIQQLIGSQEGTDRVIGWETGAPTRKGNSLSNLWTSQDIPPEFFPDFVGRDSGIVSVREVVRTGLTAALTPGGTTIRVKSVVGLPVDEDFVVELGLEKILVRRAAGNTLTVLQRGIEGTVPAAHKRGATLSAAFNLQGPFVFRDVEFIDGGSGDDVFHILGEAGFSGGVDGKASTQATFLAAPVSATATTITVLPWARVSATGRFTIRVGQELMIVTGGWNTETWTVIRGAQRTTRAAHAEGAVVVFNRGIGDGNIVALTGTGEDDQIGLTGRTAGGENPGMITIQELDTLFTNIKSVLIDGGAGNDRIKLDFSNGVPFPLLVDVVGALGNDQVVVLGANLNTSYNLTRTTGGKNALRVKNATIANTPNLITFGTVETLTVFAGAGINHFIARGTSFNSGLSVVRYIAGGPDRVDLTPSLTTRFFVDGRNLRTGVFFIWAGARVKPPTFYANSGRDAIFQFFNRQSIQFVNVERGLGGRIDVRPVLGVLPIIF